MPWPGTWLIIRNSDPRDMSRIGTGTLRFRDREEALAVIRKAVSCGFDFIETAPYYCYKDRGTNAESWIGGFFKEDKNSDRLQVAAKCTVGDGGLGLGSYIKEKGFGVRSACQLKEVLDQSLSRLGIPSVTWYFLWAIHTHEQLNEARKKGGMLDGLFENRGCWKHLGISSHADSATLLEFLETGIFGAVMLQYNVVNRTRLRVIEYCREKGIEVFIMNPFGGGLLACHAGLKELALRFLLLEESVRILIGFRSAEEVLYARKIRDTMPGFAMSREDIAAEVDAIVGIKGLHCTACGYCAPCPQYLNIGACLSFYNLYHFFRRREMKEAFLRRQWQTDIQLFRCRECGLCEKRCPNRLPVLKLIRQAKTIFYG